MSTEDLPIASVSIAWTTFKLETKPLDPQTGLPSGSIIAEFDRNASP